MIKEETRGRKKGTPKTGGRQKGTPNKDVPVKHFLKQHTLGYFSPNILDKETGAMVSQFDLDCRQLDPAARVDAETKILKFTTPQMQSTSVDVNVIDADKTLSERLVILANGGNIPSPSD